MKQPSGPKPSPAERERIESIASNQRMIILVMLAYLAVGWLGSAAARPGPDAAGIQIAFGVVALCVAIAGVVFAVRMAGALHGPGGAALWVILLLIPVVGLITLLVLNGRATGELKKAGLKVGFLGVPSSELDAWRWRD